MAMASFQQPQRNCVSCGRSIDWNANICQYCGHDYRSRTQFARPPKKNHTTALIVVVVVILIVVVVILPLLMYIMVLGFGGTSSTPAVNILRKSSIAGGFKIEFTAPTAEVEWSDASFRLSDASGHLTSCNPTTAALTSSTPPATQANPFGAQTLGLLNVWINVTDIAGNGKMNTGDYVTLQCIGSGQFSSSVTYALTLVYMPTGGLMVDYSFGG
jgi:predicted nucleic acid-binding Zn ribbon protein